MSSSSRAETVRPYPPELNRIARGGSGNLFGAAGGAVLTLLVTLVVTRTTDPTTAGALFALTSAFLIVTSIAEFGSDVSLAKFLPSYLVHGRVGDAVATVRIATILGLAAGGVVCITMVILAGDISQLVLGKRNSASATAVIVLAVFVPIGAVMSTALSASRGFGSIRPTIFVDKIGRNLLQVVCLLGVVAMGTGLVGLTVAWALPYCVAAAGALVWFELGLRAHGDGRQRVTPRGDLLRKYMKFTWPRVIARISQSVLQRSDIVLVAALRSPAEAAVYTVATRLFVVGQTATQAIQQVAAPQLSRLMALGQETATKKMVQTVTAWTMSLTWPYFLACLSLGSALLAFFGGDTYRSGSIVVVLLTVAALLAAAGGPVDLILLMAGRSGYSLANSLAALAVNLTLNLLLIPGYGVAGAATAWAGAIVTRNALGVLQVRAHLHWLPFSRATAYVAMSALVCFAIPPFVLGLSGEAPTWQLISVLAAGTLLYAFLLWRMRQMLALSAFTTVFRRRS